MYCVYGGSPKSLARLFIVSVRISKRVNKQAIGTINIVDRMMITANGNRHAQANFNRKGICLVISL